MVRAKTAGALWAAAGTDTAWDSNMLSHGYSQTFEITYVDDEAIHLAATSSKSLLIAIPVLMRHLCKTCAYFGFQINWKPGKTECFLALRGKRAQETRSKLVKIDDGLAIPLPPDCGATSLRIVSEYKHLGSTIANNGAAVPDVPLRATSALAAYSPLARKVFGAIRIQRTVRLRLFSSLVVSQLTYNVHTWSNITLAMYAKLNSVYMRGLRRIAAKSKFSAESAHAAGSDQLIREELGAPSLYCLIVRRRLMLTAAVLKYAAPHVAALLASCATNTEQQQLPWVKLVIDDLSHLKAYHAWKLSELGPPSESPSDWVNLMTNFPGPRKQLVKSYHFGTCEFDLPKTRTFTSPFGHSRFIVQLPPVRRGFHYRASPLAAPEGQARESYSPFRLHRYVICVPCLLRTVQ